MNNGTDGMAVRGFGGSRKGVRRRPFRYGTLEIAEVFGVSVQQVRRMRAAGLDLGDVRVLAKAVADRERFKERAMVVKGLEALAKALKGEG